MNIFMKCWSVPPCDYLDLFCVHAVVQVSFVSSIYQVQESSREVTICLMKDAETAVPFSITVQPFETTLTLPDTSRATGI